MAIALYIDNKRKFRSRVLVPQLIPDLDVVDEWPEGYDYSDTKVVFVHRGNDECLARTNQLLELQGHVWVVYFTGSGAQCGWIADREGRVWECDVEELLSNIECIVDELRDIEVTDAGAIEALFDRRLRACGETLAKSLRSLRHDVLHPLLALDISLQMLDMGKPGAEKDVKMDRISAEDALEEVVKRHQGLPGSYEQEYGITPAAAERIRRVLQELRDCVPQGKAKPQLLRAKIEELGVAIDAAIEEAAAGKGEEPRQTR